MGTDMQMTYQDCPECGARKIRESVRLCEVCEVSQRYEKRIEELQALLDLANAMHDVAVKERDLARYQLAKLTEAPKPRPSGKSLCPYCGQPAGSADCQRSHP